MARMMESSVGISDLCSADGSGNFFQDAVRAAVLKEVSPYALRKAFAAQQES